MLVGVRLHIAATFHGLRILRMTGQHLPVSAHRPLISPAVNQALQTAMSSLVTDRFRNMEEFLSALGFGASGEFHSSDWSETTPAGGDHDAMRRGAGGLVDTTPVDVVVSTGTAPRKSSLVALITVAARQFVDRLRR